MKIEKNTKQYQDQFQSLIVKKNKKNIINALENFSIVSKTELVNRLSSFKDGETISCITIDKYYQLLEIAIFYMDYSPQQKLLKKFNNYKDLELISDLLLNYFNHLNKKNSISTGYNVFVSGLSLWKDKVTLPYGLTIKDDFKDNFKRMLDIKNINSLIIKKYLQEIEQSMRSKKSVTSYISNYNSKVLNTIRNDKLKSLEKTVITNTNSGNSYNMKEMALKSEQNSLNEMIFKTNVVQEEAKLKGFEFLFITLTLPPAYHSKDKANKYDTKKGHNDLNKYWSDVRVYISKNLKLKSSQDYYYITVNESHKDGCEHRHIMFFCKKENHDKIIKILNRVYLKRFYPKVINQDAKIKKLSRAVWCVKQDKTLKNTATASTYLLKYILKTVDVDSTEINPVKKWARLNSIRQFNIAGLNDINFQAYKAMQKIFNSENSLLNIDKILEEFPNVSKGSLSKITMLLSSKISNYEKLKSVQEYLPTVRYVKSLNKYDEEITKPESLIMFVDNEIINIKTDHYYKKEEQTEEQRENAILKKLSEQYIKNCDNLGIDY